MLFAHLLRQGIIDKYIWATDNPAPWKVWSKTKGERVLSNETLERREYERILALTESPPIEGQRKQTKSRNLLDRFIQYRTEINRFTVNFAVPNNQAERDNTKVKMKVSGGFRSEDGAKNFGKISSVVGTATKQKRGVFDTVKSIFSGTLISIFDKPLTVG